MATKLALPERYDLYVKVSLSQIPRRTILAEDVAALGQPARDYTLKRALGGDFVDMSQTLPVLKGFGRGCSREELARLLVRAERVSSAGTARALKASIETMCGAGLPSGD